MLTQCGMFSRRFAGFDPVSESLAKHAHQTEFHCSGKLITATRADAFVLCFHGLNRRSDAAGASQRRTAIDLAGSDTVRRPPRNSAVCFTKNLVFH